MATYQSWVSDGKPWYAGKPVADLATTLRRYGYTVYILGDDRHLHASPPEDHTPFSATGWPVASPYPWVHACDIMPPAAGSGLPSLAQLGAQLFADKQAGVAGWLKYMNWEPSGPGGPCYHDSWQPGHARASSTDRGHIHLSIRSDTTRSTAAAGYDPVARLRGTDDMTPDQAAQLKQVYNAVFFGGPSMGSAAPVKINTTSAGNALVDLIQALRADTAALKTQLAALGAKDLVDEAEIARQVLAGLTPAGIADAVVAALPPALAAQVVTELGARITPTSA